MNNEITLLSSSREREAILSELGYIVKFPKTFIDVERDEKDIVISDIDSFSKEVIDLKANAYLNSGAVSSDGKYLIADTIIYFVYENHEYILGKCKSKKNALKFFSYYKNIEDIKIRTSMYLLKNKNNNIDKKFLVDTATIEFIKGNKRLIDDSFIEYYITNVKYKNRAGAIDYFAFKECGFNIVGSECTIRGICPF